MITAIVARVACPGLVSAAVAGVGLALAIEAGRRGGLRVPDDRRVRGRVAGRPPERLVLPSAAASLGLVAVVSAHLSLLLPHLRPHYSSLPQLVTAHSARINGERVKEETEAECLRLLAVVRRWLHGRLRSTVRNFLVSVPRDTEQLL